MKNPRQTGDELKSFWRKDRRTLARETTNRSIWRSLSPCTGSGRRPFRESDPNRTRWWRRVSALLNRLNDLDVTPFPVTRQLYPAANKSLLLPPSLSLLSSPLSLSRCFRSAATRVPFYVSLLILPLERIDAGTGGKSRVRRDTQPIMASWYDHGGGEISILMGAPAHPWLTLSRSSPLLFFFSFLAFVFLR